MSEDDVIDIKKANDGEFTAKAKEHGLTDQEYADQVLADPDAPEELREQAQFAKNAEGFKKSKRF